MMLECPTCKYDLTGLDDGNCPECGGAFARVVLEEDARRRAEYDGRRAGLRLARSCALIAMPASVLVAGASLQGLWVAAVLAVMTAVLGARVVRAMGGRERADAVQLCWIAIAVIASMGALREVAGVVSHTLCALGLLGALPGVTRRRAWIAGLVCVPMLGLTVLAVVQARERAAGGYVFLDFDWHDRRSLRVAEVGWVVVMTAALSVVAVVGFWVWGRREEMGKVSNG